MWYVSREGYLKHIIEMLSSEDNELLKMLSPQQSQPKILFTYELKYVNIIHWNILRKYMKEI